MSTTTRSLRAVKLGAVMFDASGRMQPAAWPIMGGVLVALLVFAALFRAWERRRLRRAPSE